MALALLVAGPTCSYPTDDSDSVEVVISGTAYVLRGDQDTLVARAVRVAGADTADLTNVMYSWTSTDPTVATVRDLGRGGAEVTGVDTGAVDIVARPVAFEDADARPFTLRVSNPIVVDSVRPDSVSWGDTLTVFGFGVDSLLTSASLGPVDLLKVPRSERRDSVTGLAQVTYWVPYPATTGSLFFIGAGLSGFAPTITRVAPQDLYEPNDAAPRAILLDTLTPPVPSNPAILLRNPLLVFEPLGPFARRADWYRFEQGVLRDLTIIIRAPFAQLTFLSDAVSFNATSRTYSIGLVAWSIGPRSHACLGLSFAPRQRVGDSSIVALGGLGPQGAFRVQPRLHQVLGYEQPGVYALAVIEGYVVTDPSIPRDAHEEDDFCDVAEPTGQDAPLPLPYRDTLLTIDNPGDVDWFRVTGTGQLVRMRTAAFGPASSAVRDTTRDIDLYLIQVPVGGETPPLTVLAVDSTAGPNADFTRFLTAGVNYYVVVVDATGGPTRYGLCLGIGGSCDTFPVAASAGAIGGSRRSPAATGGLVSESSKATSARLPDARRPPSARP